MGEPAFIENIIREANEKTQTISDPVLRCLVEIEETVRQLTQLSQPDGEASMKQANNLIQLASDIVEALTGEKVRD